MNNMLLTEISSLLSISLHVLVLLTVPTRKSNNIRLLRCWYLRNEEVEPTRWVAEQVACMMGLTKGVTTERDF